jgi:hypothetical protein
LGIGQGTGTWVRLYFRRIIANLVNKRSPSLTEGFFIK